MDRIQRAVGLLAFAATVIEGLLAVLHQVDRLRDTDTVDRLRDTDTKADA